MKIFRCIRIKSPEKINILFEGQEKWQTIIYFTNIIFNIHKYKRVSRNFYISVKLLKQSTNEVVKPT